jgi:hypothetical protein
MSKLPNFEVLLAFYLSHRPASFPPLAQNPLLLSRHIMQIARTSNNRTYS